MSGNYPDGITTGTPDAPWNQPEPSPAQDAWAWAAEEGAIEALRTLRSFMAEFQKYLPDLYKDYFGYPDAMIALERLQEQFASLLEA